MIKTTNQYCLEILSLGVRHVKALANLVMALSSQKVSSVVELSESPVFHYQYSSIADAIHHIALNREELLSFERQVLQLCFRGYYEVPLTVYLATDKTVVPKPHSPCFDERTIVACSNPAFTARKSLIVGYDYSWVNLQFEGSWSIPISALRIPVNQTIAQVGGQQINRLLSDEAFPFKDVPLVVNTLDSGYGGSGYLPQVKTIANLVSVICLRHGSRIWSPPQKGSHRCKIYGQKYYLLAEDRQMTYKKHPKTGQPYVVEQNAITNKPPEEELQWESEFKTGRMVRFRVRRFNDLLLRTTDHVAMNDIPFDVVLVEVFDVLTNELVFKKPQFLGIFGQKKHEVKTSQAPQIYRKRYNIEPFFRVVKQKMGLEKFQTPVPQHLDNWMYVIVLACWLLYTTRSELLNQPKKWQRYADKISKAGPLIQSLAQAQKAALPYLLTFDNSFFLPQKCKPGPGRQKGECQPQRTKYKYVKKNAKILYSKPQRPP